MLRFCKWLIISPAGFSTLVVLLLFLVYGKTINFDFGLDDHLFLREVPSSATGFAEGTRLVFTSLFNNGDYRPVFIYSYYLQQMAFGEIDAGVSHLVNILLYACNVILFFLLIRRYLFTQHFLLPALAALVFLAHPVHTEVVCNLKSRDNLLSMLFGLMSCHFLFSYFLGKKNIAFLFAGYLAFFIALCSKLDAVGFVVFTAVVLAAKETGWKRTAFNFAAMIFLIVVRRNIISGNIEADSTLPALQVTFTENPLPFGSGFGTVMAAGIHTAWMYIVMMLKPFGYLFYYGYNQVALFTIAEPMLYVFLVIHLVLVGAAVYYFRKNKLLFISIFSFYGFLLYCLNIEEPVAGIIAVRYAFLASLSFCLLVPALDQFIRTEHKKYFYYSLAVYILILAGFSFLRADAWKDKLTLIETDMPELEKSYEAQRIAASVYMENFEQAADTAAKKSFLLKALQHTKKANAIFPQNSVMHQVQGIILFNTGDIAAAKKELLLAWQNDSTETGSLEMLGDIYYLEKNMQEAVHYYKLAARDSMTNDLANKISTVLYESGKTDECVAFNVQLIKQQPELFAPYENLGYFYMELNDHATAKKYFDLAKQKGLKDPTPL